MRKASIAIEHEGPFAGDPLTDDAIAGTFRIFQRVNGHRFSLDDVLTAQEAIMAAEARNLVPQRVADIGTGIGSVLLMLAHRLHDATFVTVEAQEISFALLQRNVARNGLGDRIRTLLGDLRDDAILTDMGIASFDLVTGTPPYFPVDKAVSSADSQRAHARMELRGGIEDYAMAASKLLRVGGLAAICGDARFPERAAKGAADAGLTLLTHRDAIPREGRPPLFSVWTFTKEDGGPSTAAPTILPPFVVRDAAGIRTPMADAQRAFFDPPAKGPKMERP